MEATTIDPICIDQNQLAARWCISPRTLERWRWLGEGPTFLKLGKRVIYRVADIERYEETLVRMADAASQSS